MSASTTEGRIVWLASYPKSGNTWLRVLLTNYRRDGDEPADINALDGGPIASARVWFDEWSGVEATKLPPEVVDRLRPDVYRCLAREADDTLFMKVHDAWSRVDTGEAMFPTDVTARVIYVVRNPLDVAPSYAHHMGVDVETAVERMCDPDHGLSLGPVSQLRQRMGTWSDHVRSWVDDSGLPVHVVRYEDLHAEPTAALRNVLHAAGVEVDERRLAKAVAFSAFRELRAQEGVAGFRERPTAADGFFRRGEVGSWRDELAPHLAARLVDAHREVMSRLGYEVAAPEVAIHGR